MVSILIFPCHCLLPQHVLLETPCQDKDRAKPTPWFEYEGLALNW